MKSNLQLALTLIVISACDTNPPPINEFITKAPSAATQEWLSDVFLHENPNAAEYRLVKVNSAHILDDAERVSIMLLNGEVITAIKGSSEVHDGSIRWNGAVEGVSDSDVQILATNKPYLQGHVVMGERVELFTHPATGADSIMYRVDMPDRSLSPLADILPDADPDPDDINGIAWRGLLHGLPASAYRITEFDEETWRKKIEELVMSGTTEMHFSDDTPYRIESKRPNPANKPTLYPWRIVGEEYSSVALYGNIGPGLRGYVQSRETGYVKVTQLDETRFYIVWTMHPDFSKQID